MAGSIYYGSTLVGNVAPKIGSFGGLMLSPGPMYLTNTGKYGLCSNFYEHTNYGTYVKGLPDFKDGYKTYFTLSELGDKFDSLGSNWSSTTTSSGDHTIDNQGTLVSGLGYNDWRMPTYDEYKLLIFPFEYTMATGDIIMTRAGSTVNNVSRVSSAAVRVSKTTDFSSGGVVYGILIFPDNETITGTNLFINTSFYASLSNPKSFGRFSFVASTTYPTLLTEAELNEYIDQGCGFMPDMGRYIIENSGGYSWICRDLVQQYDLTMYLSTYVNRSSSTMYGQTFGFNYSTAELFQFDYYNSGLGPRAYVSAGNPIYLVRTAGGNTLV